MRDRNGDTVGAHEVLDVDELADYYRQHPPRPTTGYEGMSLGADPAVVAWEDVVGEHFGGCNDGCDDRGHYLIGDGS